MNCLSPNKLTLLEIYIKQQNICEQNNISQKTLSCFTSNVLNIDPMNGGYKISVAEMKIILYALYLGDFTIVNMSYNFIQKSCFDMFACMLASDNTIKELVLDSTGIRYHGAHVLGKALHTNQCILILNLNWCYLGNEGVKEITSGLLNNTTLETLYLEQNYINETGGIAIGHLLKYNMTLKNINLEYNPIGSLGLYSIFDALFYNTCLTTLSLGSTKLDDTSLIAKVLYENKTLVELNLDCNNIGDKGAYLLGKTLEHNNTLEILNLRSNNIGPIGACALAKALCINRTLWELNLGRNDIMDEGICIFSQVIHNNPCILILHLFGNNINDESIDVLINAISSNDCIRSLFLNFGINQVPDSKYLSIGSAIENNTTILDIELNNPNPDSLQKVLIRNRLLYKKEYFRINMSPIPEALRVAIITTFLLTSKGSFTWGKPGDIVPIPFRILIYIFQFQKREDWDYVYK